MSVKADVKIILKKENLKELDEQLKTSNFEDYELDIWNNKREIAMTRSDFILLEWNYVKWDYDTDEVVAKIIDYLNILKMNKIPCRYIAIYDVGTEDEIKSYGSDEYIAFIESCMYISREIKISDCFYDM